MLVAILTPVMGMTFLPASLAVSLVGLVVRIGGYLVLLPTGFPGPLAGLVGTESLGLDTGIGQKNTPAMGTSSLAVHDFLLGEAINLSKRTQTGRTTTKTKAHAEEKGSYGWKGGKKIHIAYR
jgi:hypothetical protein